MDSPTDYSREEYAALPVKVARALRRKWGQSPDQRATTPNGAPYPLRSWPPDAAIDIQALAEWVDPLLPQSVRSFANAAARDAAIPAPTDGMTCYLQDVKQYQGRDAQGWYPVGGAVPAIRCSLPTDAPVPAGITYMSGMTVESVAGGIVYDSATGRFTLPFDGWYSVGMYAGLNTAAGTTVQPHFEVVRGGTTGYAAVGDLWAGPSNGAPRSGGSEAARLLTTDQLRYFISAYAPGTIPGGQCHISIHWVGR